MTDEPSGEYYDYTKTMKPERPWLVRWHEKYVYRIMHARRGGTGRRSARPEMAKGRPPEHRYLFGEGKIAQLYLTFADALEVIKGVHRMTGGVEQVVLLTGWQYEGHDSKYPAWGEVNEHLKRPGDATALESLRWLIREARQYNCLATLHINMFDAYEDSPLFEAYAAKDILAKDESGQLIVGNRWSGMDCYHVSYAQEWKHGLAQKRIDDLLAMVPEVRENHCVYVDAFLGARVASQKGPISPYLDFSKEDEGRTQRKIFRYWRDREVDVASEHVWAMRVDRFIGLQPHSAAQGDLIEDLPNELYCSNPAHFGFETVGEPEGFRERFWLEFLPWVYKNHGEKGGPAESMIDGTDICIPLPWCEGKAMAAYSKAGYEQKAWTLPGDWGDVQEAAVEKLSFEGAQPAGDVVVADGRVTLSLGEGEVMMLRAKAQPSAKDESIPANTDRRRIQIRSATPGIPDSTSAGGRS